MSLYYNGCKNVFSRSIQVDIWLLFKHSSAYMAFLLSCGILFELIGSEHTKKDTHTPTRATAQKNRKTPTISTFCYKIKLTAFTYFVFQAILFIAFLVHLIHKMRGKNRRKLPWSHFSHFHIWIESVEGNMWKITRKKRLCFQIGF